MLEAGFARPVTLLQPERIVAPFPWIGHIPFAFWIIDVLRPRQFVELGTHSGNSFCAFLQAAAAISSAGKFQAVDHWKGDGHSGGYEEDVYQDLRRYIETRYGNASALLRMSFDEAAGQFEDGSIDLLHIDGLHTYEAVRHDFETWLPKMSSRGVVLFHDTAVRRGDFGVYRLFAELAERYPAFEFVHSYGLGVIQTGTEELPAAFATLFRSPTDSFGISPRNYFGRLGGALIDSHYYQLLSDDVMRRARIESELGSFLAQQRQLEAALSRIPPVNRTVDVHYDQAGGDERRADAIARMVLASGFFNPSDYRIAAGLPELDDIALVRHYIDRGEAAGLRPSRHFDPRYYRQENSDVVQQDLNTLVHYLTHGRLEGRHPSARMAAEAGGLR